MRITIRDVAASLNLSVATVSLALNGSPLVKKETVARVKAEAERMGYAPNLYARGLASGHSGNIALIVPDIRNNFFATLVYELNAAMEKAGYHLTISISDESIENERAIIRSMEQMNVEMIIIAPVNRPIKDAQYIQFLNALHTPILFTTAKYFAASAPCVMSDLRQGMRQLVAYIVALGDGDIAYLTGPAGVQTLDMRERGYTEMLATCGMAPTILRMDIPSYANAYDILRGMPAEKLPRTLLCANDMTALGALNALTERGIDVPGRVRIAGYDDVIFSRISLVPLTTVRQNIAEIARISADMAKRYLSGNITDWADQTVPCDLIVRSSTT